MNSQIIKTCACGISYTKDGWHALELIGFQSLVGVPADAMASDSLELRNCSCGSTLHVEVNLLDIIGSANRALKAARDATREHSVVKGGLDLVGILLSRPDILEKALDRANPLIQDVLDKAKKGPQPDPPMPPLGSSGGTDGRRCVAGGGQREDGTMCPGCPACQSNWIPAQRGSRGSKGTL